MVDLSASIYGGDAGQSGFKDYVMLFDSRLLTGGFSSGIKSEYALGQLNSKNQPDVDLLKQALI